MEGVHKLSQADNTGHLGDGFRPIMGCFADASNLNGCSDIKTEFYKQINFIREYGTYIQYEYLCYPEKSEGVVRYPDGCAVYAISDVDVKPKYSTGYVVCTGLAGVGVSKTNGRPISFLTHQDPDYVLLEVEYRTSFMQDLDSVLAKMYSLSVPGSVDIVMFGGMYAPCDSEYRALNLKHRALLKILDEKVLSHFKFHPVYISGPAYINFADSDFYLDPVKRRLYIVKAGSSSHPELNLPFIYPDFDKQIKCWEHLHRI